MPVANRFKVKRLIRSVDHLKAACRFSREKEKQHGFVVSSTDRTKGQATKGKGRLLYPLQTKKVLGLHCFQSPSRPQFTACRLSTRQLKTGARKRFRRKRPRRDRRANDSSHVAETAAAESQQAAAGLAYFCALCRAVSLRFFFSLLLLSRFFLLSLPSAGSSRSSAI